MTTNPMLRLATLWCALTLMVLTGPVLAQGNLLSNPGFRIDLSGWDNLYAGDASWSSRDADDSMSSGSAVVGNTANPSNGGAPLVLSQCVTVSPSTIYEFGGRMLVPTGQPQGTYPAVFVYTYASSKCNGPELQSDNQVAASVEEWELERGTITTDAGANSIRFLIGVSKAIGVTAPAYSHFDNLFLRRVGEPGGFVINPSMSASWYNPAQSGHGIMIELLDATRAWMCWFTFDLQGNRAWICALGDVSGNALVFAEAFTVNGGNFPPLFDATKIVEVPWGSITVTFAGCGSGTMEWSTTKPGFQSGSMPLVRLTKLWGTNCP